MTARTQQLRLPSNRISVLGFGLASIPLILAAVLATRAPSASAASVTLMETNCLSAIPKLQGVAITPQENKCHQVTNGEQIYWRAGDLEPDKFKQAQDICNSTNSYAMYVYESSSTVACYYTSNG